MISIDNTIVSDDLFEKQFVCDLSCCKGACCIEGDAGAPLEMEEISLIQDCLDEIIPYMTEDGKNEIDKNEFFDYDINGNLGTALVKGKQCVFVYFENNIAFCAIEKAFNEKKIDYQKPISCHLYPIRIKKYKSYDAVNYDKWHICKDALKLGKRLKVPVFKFLEEPLIRNYGRKWFKKLEKEYLEFSKK